MMQKQRVWGEMDEVMDGRMDGKSEERRLNWTLLRQQISHRCRLQAGMESTDSHARSHAKETVAL